MKTTTALLLGLAMVAATSMRAQEPSVQTKDEPRYFSAVECYKQANIAKITTGYLRCLASENHGAVESAIAHVTFIRIALPEVNLAEIEAALKELAFTGATQAIRYKAYLATQVYANPKAFAKVLENTYFSGDEMFAVVVSQLQPLS
jgi:hypothetical protein